MPTFRVFHKITLGDGIHWPGEKLVNPERANLLVDRGLIVQTGDDPPLEEAGAGSPDTIEALVRLNRDVLNSRATGLGIEDPDKLGSKRAVAEEILAREKAAKEAPDEGTYRDVIAGLSDEDLEGSLAMYEVSHNATSREDKEAVLLAWALEHPEVFTPEETEMLVDSSEAPDDPNPNPDTATTHLKSSSSGDGG